MRGLRKRPQEGPKRGQKRKAQNDKNVKILRKSKMLVASSTPHSPKSTETPSLPGSHDRARGGSTDRSHAGGLGGAIRLLPGCESEGATSGPGSTWRFQNSSKKNYVFLTKQRLLGRSLFFFCCCLWLNSRVYPYRQSTTQTRLSQ